MKKWPEKFQELNLVWQILAPLERVTAFQGFIDMVILQGYLIPNCTELLLDLCKKWGSGGFGNWREGVVAREEKMEKKIDALRNQQLVYTVLFP